MINCLSIGKSQREAALYGQHI